MGTPWVYGILHSDNAYVVYRALIRNSSYSVVFDFQLVRVSTLLMVINGFLSGDGYQYLIVILFDFHFLFPPPRPLTCLQASDTETLESISSRILSVTMWIAQIGVVYSRRCASVDQHRHFDVNYRNADDEAHTDMTCHLSVLTSDKAMVQAPPICVLTSEFRRLCLAVEGSPCPRNLTLPSCLTSSKNRFPGPLFIFGISLEVARCSNISFPLSWVHVFVPQIISLLAIFTNGCQWSSTQNNGNIISLTSNLMVCTGRPHLSIITRDSRKSH